MYAASNGRHKALGDVDVVYHDGIYHLFHLVLPSHDFIAHAVSNDCFNWRRVENALFLGDPGSFDDFMVWTMHVTPHPYRPGWWRMFYTGLSRRECGAIQRIGMAESCDLFRWEKVPTRWVDHRSPLPYDLPGQPPQPPFAYDPNSSFPIEPDPQYYEASLSKERRWVSWRDPFYYREGDRGWLLIAGHVNHGPVIHRGCVAKVEEVAPNRFECRPPLHHPGVFDDIEVPNLFRENDNYYLVGSIREDSTVRYWQTQKLDEHWTSYTDCILLPSGNYAGRICKDETGWLLFSFFTPGGGDRTVWNVMPPPKRLIATDSGHLIPTSHEGMYERVEESLPIDGIAPLRTTVPGQVTANGDTLDLWSDGDLQLFVFPQDTAHFRLEMDLQMITDSKCGLAFRFDRKSHDGYYIRLNLFMGVADAIRWSKGPFGSADQMMQFHIMQSGNWRVTREGAARLKLVAYGSYIELSVENRVVLALADQQFEDGAIGISVETGRARATDVQLERLQPPVQSDHHLVMG